MRRHGTFTWSFAVVCCGCYIPCTFRSQCVFLWVCLIKSVNNTFIHVIHLLFKRLQQNENSGTRVYMPLLYIGSSRVEDLLGYNYYWCIRAFQCDMTETTIAGAKGPCVAHRRCALVVSFISRRKADIHQKWVSTIKSAALEGPISGGGVYILVSEELTHIERKLVSSLWHEGPMNEHVMIVCL
jgi:hypothetical protein